MALLVVVLVALVIQIVLVVQDGNRQPCVGDALENHNIAWNLAHGRGYGFDRDDDAWRRLIKPSAKLPILARHGAGPTAARPPLVPMIGAAIVRLFPAGSFLAWRVLDAALLIVAAGLVGMAALRTAGPTAALIAGGICAADPLRLVVLHDAWMTEPISCFLMAVLLALFASLLRSRRVMTLVGAALCIGLLVLARSSFVLLMPGLVALTAWCWERARHPHGLGTARSFAGSAALVLLVSCLVALPWWIRNCRVLQDFMPLGTQAGFNLPDEYSDVAIETGGIWSGLAMRMVWAQRWGDPALLPDLGPEGFPSEAHLSQLWPGGDRAFGWMIYGLSSGHILLERDLALTGRNAAIAWLFDHPARVPQLMLAKVAGEIRPVVWWLVLPLIAALALRRGTRGTLVVALWAVLILGLMGIALTHSVNGRFLVPYTPALAVLVGIACSGRRKNAV